MASVLIFGPTGQVGSVAAATATSLNAKVTLAMRDTSKPIPSLPDSSNYAKVQADLTDPTSVANAVKASGATRAFVYLAQRDPASMRAVAQALKDAGITFVVFLSSQTIPHDKALKEVEAENFIPYLHAQYEAALDDVFGEENYVAIRPGAFVSNFRTEIDGVAAGKVSLVGADFKMDSVIPADIGRVAGSVLVEGPKNGQKKVYVYGPQILSMEDSLKRIGSVLGREIEVQNVPAESVDKSKVPPPVKYRLDRLAEEREGKGWKERFWKYEEGVKNVELYTGKPATTLEEWVAENKAIFGA
ncbi:NAD(P)-binding protein [Periconia macrospinosa]|uniref:NAD(P)-binding protein n=1 Tax=Periconia macrospinosa TaxID=97972 RepID=A0A2V1DR89_9PLEO|nr:NAD(P)-binding protein [Periconia macrospinosa]